MSERDGGDPRAALVANDLAHRQAAYEADFRLRQAVHEARIAVYQASTERARAGAEFCRNAAAGIGTVYGALLGVSFAAKDGVPMPASGAIPAFFLALSLVLAASYVAFVMPSASSEVPAPAPHSSLAVDQERRVDAFGAWVGALVERRVPALQSAVLSLGAGVAFLPVPFVGWSGLAIWIAAAVSAATATLGPYAFVRLRPRRRDAQSPTRPKMRRVSPAAEMRRAAKLDKAGDYAGQAAALELVVASGHAKLAPRAAVELGRVRSHLGDLAGARSAYEFAMDSSDEKAMPAAAYELGVLCEATGDVDGALEAYRLGSTADDRRIRSHSWFQTGCLLLDRGRYVDARDAIERALAIKEPADETGFGPLRLGQLLAEHFPHEEAAIRAALEAAIGGPSNYYANDAQMLLGDVLLRNSDPEGAVAAYQAVIDRGFYSHWPTAALRLAAILRQNGDIDGAKQACRRVFDEREHLSDELSSRAGLMLGQLLEAAGDCMAAQEAYAWAQQRTEDRSVSDEAKAGLARLGEATSVE